MEAGVVQDIRKELMGHSSGKEINAVYTHVELPAKREAIRKLEAWLAAQREELEKPEPQKGGTEQADGGVSIRPDLSSDLGESDRRIARGPATLQ